jgi:hypothetical protein
MVNPLPTTTVAAPPLPPIPLLTRRQEAYARCVAEGMSYAQAFRTAGLNASTAMSQSNQIQDLNRLPHVRARIAELRVHATERAASTVAERMAWLRLIITADPNELTRTVRDPCDLCWTDADIAAAYTAHFASAVFDPEAPRPGPPDPTQPRHGCQHCKGKGYTHVILTPSDQLSPEGRALFKGCKQNAKGEIEVLMHDQLAAAEMLNKLQSAYVTRSMNLNANVAVPIARDADPNEALKLFDAFGS